MSITDKLKFWKKNDNDDIFNDNLFNDQNMSDPNDSLGIKDSLAQPEKQQNPETNTFQNMQVPPPTAQPLPQNDPLHTQAFTQQKQQPSLNSDESNKKLDKIIDLLEKIDQKVTKKNEDTKLW